MTHLKPIQFDGPSQLEKLREGFQKKRDLLNEAKARFSAALPSVSPKVEDVLNSALKAVVEKVKEPSFAKALVAAREIGPQAANQFCADFRSAVSKAIPSSFPVVTENVTKSVRVVGPLGEVSTQDRLMPETSIEQTYFGAVLYKHGLHELLDAVSGLANVSTEELQGHLADFEHTTGTKIQRRLDVAKEDLGGIRFAVPLQQRMYDQKLRMRQENLSKEDEHRVVYHSMLTGLGMTKDNEGMLFFDKKSDLDVVRKRVNSALNQTAQENRHNNLSIEAGLVGVEGNVGSIDGPSRASVLRISRAFKSALDKKLNGNKPSSKPRSP